MNYAMSVSTFMSEGNFVNRFEIFKDSIESLLNTNFKGDIYIVDDASFTSEHLIWADSKNDPRIKTVKRVENGGVSKNKNTGIKLIMSNPQVNFGVLSDDDMLYIDPNWHDNYFNAMSSSKVHHFSYAIPGNARKGSTIVNHNNFKIEKTPMINGCMLTITRELIDNIGYFKIFPYKFGHEHTNFTVRSITSKLTPFFCDAVDSDKWVKINEKSYSIRSMTDINQEQFNHNTQFIYDKLLKINCEE